MGQNRVQRLEVAVAAIAAASISSRGNALALSSRIERTARVTVVTAGAGSREVVDGVDTIEHDSLALASDGTAANTSSRTRAADTSALRGLLAALDGNSAAVVVVNLSRQADAADGLDIRKVVARERGAGKRADVLAANGPSGCDLAACLTAVASRHKATRDSEAVRATGLAVNDVRVAADNAGSGGGQALDGADLVLGISEAAECSKLVGAVLAVIKGLDDELVGSNVDKVRGNAGEVGLSTVAGLEGASEVVVHGLLGSLELGKAGLHDNRDGTGSLDLLGGSLVSDTNVCLGGVDPAASELVAVDGVGQLGDELCGFVVGSHAGDGLLGIEAKIALHGLEDLRVQAVGGLCGCAVRDGEHDGKEGEKVGELHCEVNEYL